ncbi:superfamily II DNA or RNA helicase [Evansella vedderi]|uniref:Superfamily II DNA or RNA helicase n=1 Tax=Evansella vedderi TaxID=38282 RepID=A0ABU0A1Z6_9BACI|nr:DISARM system SNF2-like helicase DrmD [Evansella vedderi]MDQ0257511.1 superfamily II DNA or RNA helicase [Evansella vedderi]
MHQINKDIPKSGQLVVVRGRPAIVRGVQEYRTMDNHFSYGVEIAYTDGWNYPNSDFIIWENEVGARIIKGNMLPKIDNHSIAPDRPENLQAFLDSYKWSSINRLDENEVNDIKLIGPWQSAIQIEDYQLYPVLKALSMPRVSLLLADDVGLGKTIEAGLIISELFARNKVKRILIVCPAALQNQWKEELKEKFYLDFEIVDRDRTFRLQKEFGIDSNPWATFPRIITSMDYLRQKDIQESFRSANEQICGNNESLLPWQLLIVDEAHNFAPATLGKSSERYKMLRQFSLQFEHRLFLTATPHNGYTHSFTGLLELLDPVRFTQKTSMDSEDLSQINLTMVRRLKSDLNKISGGNRFANRFVKSLDISIRGLEKDLFIALRWYRNKGSKLLKTLGKKEKYIGDFLFNLLTKRLLSNSYSFASTWWQHVAGLDRDMPAVDELNYSINRVEAPINDDTEKNDREDDMLRKGGAWLHRFSDDLKSEMENVSSILREMGLGKDLFQISTNQFTVFPPDAKWDCLKEWICSNLTDKGKYLQEERVIIFTEYKQTMDYFVERFRSIGVEEPVLQCLYGGMTSERRQEIKKMFNDPLSSVRILLATDAAAEGINLQTNCRFIIHLDIPWNPMRLEQRNGRVDRHGQFRDVIIHHFNSADEEDMRFMSRIVSKVDRVREDLGTVGQVFDQAIINYFNDKNIDEDKMDSWVELTRSNIYEKQDLSESDKGNQKLYSQSLQRLRLTEMELGLEEHRLANVLTSAMIMENGELKEVEPGVYRITQIPPSWKKMITENLEISGGVAQGALPKIVFDPSYFEELVNNRKVFKSKSDTVLLRLGHPIMQKALSTMKKALWDQNGLGRWTIEKTKLPNGFNQILVIHYILEANNNLRENFHQEFISVPFQVSGEILIPLEKEFWNQIKNVPRNPLNIEELKKWRHQLSDQWMDFEPQLRQYLKERKLEAEVNINTHLKEMSRKVIKNESDRYDRRIKELRKSSQSNAQKKLLKEIEQQRGVLEQGSLFVEFDIEEKQKLRELELQLELIVQNYEYMRTVLEREKKRVIEHVFPKRFNLAHIDIQPLALQYIVNTM